MRRLFIMRKDLEMSPGKLAAQVGHCCEAYWTNLIRNSINEKENGTVTEVTINLPNEVLTGYVNDRFTKTICSAKNLFQLLKARDMALELGLVEGVDFGLINDACFTELTPENDDGTCTTGIWFGPLPDDVAHKISKKYQLYR